MSRQPSSMSESDMDSPANDMDQAMSDLVVVVQTHVQQEISSIATPIPAATPGPQKPSG